MMCVTEEREIDEISMVCESIAQPMELPGHVHGTINYMPKTNETTQLPQDCYGCYQHTPGMNVTLNRVLRLESVHHTNLEL